MKKTLMVLCLAFMLLLSGGCSMIRVEEGQRTPLEYTVVSSGDIPKEVKVLMEEKKSEEFQMTYQSGEDLYLIKGYGRQMTGGYSIQVEELGLSANAIFFRTQLLGPEDDEPGGELSYPCIVVKTGFREEPVIFE